MRFVRPEAALCMGRAGSVRGQRVTAIALATRIGGISGAEAVQVDLGQGQAIGPRGRRDVLLSEALAKSA